MDSGGWQAIVHGAAQTRTQLSNWAHNTHMTVFACGTQKHLGCAQSYNQNCGWFLPRGRWAVEAEHKGASPEGTVPKNSALHG